MTNPAAAKKAFATRLAALLGAAIVSLSATALAVPPEAPVAHVQAAVQATAPAPAPKAQTPAEAKAALTAAAQTTGMRNYVGTNGKVYVNPTQPPHLDAMEKVAARGTGILQIVQARGVQHTKAIFDGEMIHFQYAVGTNNWRLGDWGFDLRPSSHQGFSAMIQLTPAEAQNLRERIAAVRAEEGPTHMAGAGWANGHIKTSMGVGGFNCASAWCSMKIGEHGESLAQILGMPVHGDPNSLQPALEASRSDRIFGMAVYGPDVPDFGAHPEQPQVKR